MVPTTIKKVLFLSVLVVLVGVFASMTWIAVASSADSDEYAQPAVSGAQLTGAEGGTGAVYPVSFSHRSFGSDAGNDAARTGNSPARSTRSGTVPAKPKP